MKNLRLIKLDPKIGNDKTDTQERLPHATLWTFYKKLTKGETQLTKNLNNVLHVTVC